MSLFFFFRLGRGKKKRNGHYSHSLERVVLDSQERLYFEDLEAASKCVSEIVKHDVDSTVGSIIQALDDYLEECESDDTSYFFNSFEDISD